MLKSTSRNLICALLLLGLTSCPALVMPPGAAPLPTANALGPPDGTQEFGVDPAGETPPKPPRVDPTDNSTKSAPTVSPGQTRIFDAADGGTTSCSELLDNPVSLPPPDSSENRCLLPQYGVVANGNDPPTNFVKTGANFPPGLAVLPTHARSAVYNDFIVGGSGGVPIGAQVAVTFDYVGKIAGASVYRDALTLTLWLKDLTNGQPVGAVTLFEQNRDGDQGVTDVSGTAEIVPEDNLSNGLGVTVLRGHAYRIFFQLDAENFGAGLVRGEAQWSKLVVTIDSDGCEPVSQHRKQQGCDGIDNDCDGMIDECDEDIFGPDVSLEPDIRGKCFPGEAAALGAILNATKAADDCGHVNVTPSLSGPTCDVEGSVTATDDCGNATTISGIPLRIDGEVPLVTCSTSVTTLWPADNKFVNVGFNYSASDNCSGDLRIEVRVTSDESSTLAPGNGQAAEFPDAAILKSIDGSIVGIQLRAERDGGGDGRVYEIHVSATDKCGNVGRASTTVDVPPTGSGQAMDSGQYFDATGMN